MRVFYNGLSRNIEFRVGARRTFVRAALVCHRGGVPTTIDNDTGMADAMRDDFSSNAEGDARKLGEVAP